MASRFEANIKVGLFVTIGVSLLMVAIILLGGADSIFVRRIHYTIYLQNVDGLMVGSKVVLNGIRIGVIDGMKFDENRDRIHVGLAVERAYVPLVHKDTAVEIATQGVLGDKYVSLKGGSKELPPVENFGELTNTSTRSGNSFLSNTDQLMQNLTNVATGLDRLIQTMEQNKRSETLFEGLANTAKNMAGISEKLNRELDHIKIKATINELHSILEKVNNGTGTVGAMVNDPALYDDVKNLVGGANRNRVVRNLIRQTIRKNEEATEESAEAPAPAPKKK